jgi:hypothetical protein
MLFRIGNKDCDDAEYAAMLTMKALGAALAAGLVLPGCRICGTPPEIKGALQVESELTEADDPNFPEKPEIGEGLLRTDRKPEKAAAEHPTHAHGKRKR